MKRLVAVLLIFNLIISVSISDVLAKETYNSKGLAYCDVVTGEEVIFDDDSATFDSSLNKWLQHAHDTFGYCSNELTIISIKIKGKKIILDFNNEFNQLKDNSIIANYFVNSLSRTISINSKYEKLFIQVDGEYVKDFGELEFSNGIDLTISESEENDVEIKAYPDVPNPVIVIDPGHGGIYNNAVAADGTKEKAVVLSVANYLKSDLENKGATVIMTRTTDTQLSSTLSADLSMRADIANNNNADMFISIHANGYSNTSTKGVETFYPRYHDSTTSKSLANHISQSISTRQSMTLRTTKIGDYAVLNETEMIAVLTEIGFMTNAYDYSKMDSASDRDAMAYSIYLGIRKFWWGY
ncbi:MAG: hypothetical protein CVV02_07390 [Firmicutes bacterium HGW-Firmicutes-7]|nr:MAG: hypothetical protein CVV02_07390 [Firmicutes bacterium HGW-Firmicutes-7]